MSFELVVLLVLVPMLLGHLIAYYIGYFFQKVLLLNGYTYGKFLLIKEVIIKNHAWFEKWGNGVAFFLDSAGCKNFCFASCWNFKINIWKFIIYTFVGSLIWSIILTYIGFYLGAQWTTIQIVLKNFTLQLFFLVLVGYFVHHQLKSKIKFVDMDDFGNVHAIYCAPNQRCNNFILLE